MYLTSSCICFSNSLYLSLSYLNSSLFCIGSTSTNLYLKAATLMRKIAQVFTKNIGSLFSLCPSHLNLANFVPLKLTSTNYLLWETHEPYHLMKVRLLVPRKMAKSLNQTWRYGHALKG
jgi:hypothetical protein